MKLAEHREVPIKPSSLPFIPRIILKQRGIDRWLFQLLIVRRKVLKGLPSPFVFFNRSTIFYEYPKIIFQLSKLPKITSNDIRERSLDRITKK